jgi:hypothetical protein
MCWACVRRQIMREKDEIMEILKVSLKVPVINIYPNFYVYKCGEKRDEFQMKKIKACNFSVMLLDYRNKVNG